MRNKIYGELRFKQISYNKYFKDYNKTYLCKINNICKT